MIPGLYTAIAGMMNQQTMMEVIANNLANAGTTGYKRDELSFGGVLNDLMGPVDPYNRLTLDEFTAQFTTDFSLGPIRYTGKALDLAIDGDGFFVIQHPGGIRYTRDGNLLTNDNGLLVTAEGYPVLGQQGTITLPSTQDVYVDNEGQITINGRVIDKIMIVDFPKPYQLIKGGNNTFINQGQAPFDSSARIRQGYLEMSNANPVYEMVKMIEAMRVYEAYQKTIQLFNDTLEQTNSQLGKISS